jgi:DNA-binding SARP family transcriptional activator
VSTSRLLLFGSPRIESNGLAMEVDTRKALALAAYLGVTGQRASRDVLAALLWPDYDQARAALRRTLSVLNKALGEGALEIDRQTIGLNQHGSIWIDVREFRQRLADCRTHGHPDDQPCPSCIIPLQAAAGLYRGDFLEGFAIRDSPEFDDWQFFQAEGLRGELASALQRLTRLLSTQGRIDEAITYARRWLNLDPLHEPAHHTLIELYAWAGHRTAALRQYERCARILEQELGVTPLETTSQLYQAVKENRFPPPPIAPESTIVAQQRRTVNEPPAGILGYRDPSGLLVGRDAEWQALRAEYVHAKHSGRIVLLEGEAGIGKTRLAEELLAHAAKDGAVVLRTRSYEGEMDLAYGPFAEILRVWLRKLDADGLLNTIAAWSLREASKLVPDVDTQVTAPFDAPLDAQTARTRFFEGVSQVLLTTPPDGSAAVLFFDDVQWADQASLALLAYLARRIRGLPILLLMTARNEQAQAGGLARLLSDARRADALSVLQLERLSQLNVDELVIASATIVDTMRSSPEALKLLARRLYTETDGVPLLIHEYLTALRTGTLDPAEPAWDMPDRVHEILKSRSSAVSETAKNALATASAIGRSFDIETLQAAIEWDEETTVTAVDELVAHGLITGTDQQSVGASPSYDFSHDKLRTVVYEDTSLARRRLLHRRIAHTLAARQYAHRDAGAIAAQVAGHFQLAGEDHIAAPFFAKAGEHARSLYANVEALAHFRAALQLGHPDRRTLHEVIGDVQTTLAAYSAALESYELASERADEVERARIERKRADIYHRRGEWETAEGALRAAMGLIDETGNEAESARLRAELGLALHHQGRSDEAMTCARQALELAGVAGDPRALARAHNVFGIVASRQGEFDAACRHLELSAAAAEQGRDREAQVAALNNLAQVHGAAGDLQQAVELSEAALALCATQGDRHHEAALHNNLADLFHESGKPEQALCHIRSAVTIYAEIGVESGSVQPGIWKLTEW